MRTSAVVLAALLGSMLTGCAAKPSPRREIVRFWHPWTAEGSATILKIAARFNASQTCYQVVPLSTPGAAASTKFMLAVSGGDPPDLIASWDPVLPLWARDGIVQPLDDRLSASDRTALARAYPVARAAGSYRGGMYGLCVGLNVQALYYRPADLREAGLPQRGPRTLEELERWGDRLDRRGADGSLQRLGLLPAGLRDHAPAFGGGYAEGRIDTPGNRAALEWETRQRRKVGFDRYVRFQVGLGLDAAGGSGGGGWPFVAGRYALAVDGQWRVEEIAKYAPELVGKYRTAPLPDRAQGPKGAGYAVATLLMLPTGARHAGGAWAFARFWSGLADPEIAAEMNVAGGWLPSSPEMAAAPAYRNYVRRYPQFGTFLTAIAAPNLQTHPPIPDLAYLFDAAGKAEWLAISGARPPATALQAAQGDFDRERRRREALGERF